MHQIMYTFQFIKQPKHQSAVETDLCFWPSGNSIYNESAVLITTTQAQVPTTSYLSLPFSHTHSLSCSSYLMLLTLKVKIRHWASPNDVQHLLVSNGCTSAVLCEFALHEIVKDVFWIPTFLPVCFCACVFWRCTPLSSHGHCKILFNIQHLNRNVKPGNLENASLFPIVIQMCMTHCLCVYK